MMKLSVCVFLATGSLASSNALAQAPIGVSLRENDIVQTNLGQRPIALKNPAAQDPSSGNPLWGIPLAALSVTHERPIFSPSRRPDAPAAATAPVIEAPPPIQPAEPEHPLFALVGTVMGRDGNEAIFLDQTANAVVRLHIGEAESGWVLRSVDSRATTLEKNSQRVTLALPAPDSSAPSNNQPPSFPLPRGGNQRF